MPNIQVPKMGEAVAVNTTAAGVITVASTVPYFVGAYAYLSDNAAHNQCVLITQILTATTMRARAIPDVNSGSNVNNLSFGVGSDLSAYTTAAASRIDMPAQVVRVDQPTWSKPQSIS
jgi:hypothetical protein